MSRLKRPSLLSSRGVNLIEVMIALGIIGIVAAGIREFQSQGETGQRLSEIKMVHESIARDIENKLHSPASIYLSLMYIENAELIQCILGTGTGCLETHTNPRSFEEGETKNAFALMTPIGQSDAAPVSSSDGNRVLYDQRGRRGCNEADPECIFEAKTYWYALCPKNATCSQRVSLVAETAQKACACGAQELFLTFEVVQLKSPQVFGKGLERKFPTLPISPKVERQPVSAILGDQLSAECNLGALVTGFHANGRPVCECAPPFITWVEGGMNSRGPICRRLSAAELRCGDGQIFESLNEDGSAHCIGLDEAYECQEATNVKTGTCGEEYRIQVFQRSGCRFVCFVGKGGSVCGSHEGALPYEIILGEKPEDQFTFRSGDRLEGKYVYKENVNISDFSPSEMDALLNIAKPGGYSFNDPTTRTSFTGYVEEGIVCDEERVRCCRPKH